MDLLQYQKYYGRKTVRTLCEKVGTTEGYYQQLAYGYRTPSLLLAEKFVEETNGEIDVVSMMRAAKAGPAKDRMKYLEKTEDEQTD